MVRTAALIGCFIVGCSLSFSVWADDQCLLPLVVAKPDKPDNKLRTAMKAYEDYSSAQDESYSCEKWFKFLRDVAHVLKVASDANPSARKQLIDKEKAVRLRLFTDLNDAEFRSSDPSLYRFNTKRLGDIYEIEKDAKTFLDDVIIQDRHFPRYGSASELRQVIRRAIYSCNKWDFVHTKDIKNMRDQWSSCIGDFERLRESFPPFKAIAPDVEAFLAQQTVEE